MKWLLAAALAVLAPLCLLSAVPAGGPKVGPDLKTWDATVDKAVRFLQGTQQPSGGWSTDKTPGVTGVALTGLLRSGRVNAKDPVGAKALKYIESLVDPEHKHIAGRGAKVQLQNYVTSINVMALVQAKLADKYKGVIGDAVAFLKKLQWDEAEGKGPDSDFFGGAGYDSKSRPDLSNTQMFIDALHAAGVPKDDPALRNAIVFVSRCQNLKG
jgi:squalene-hopene/tetraprenyl-beta-curcumene cyclase